MLVQRGTLRVGDAIVAGDAWGRVRALYNYRGEKIQEATPGRSGRDPRLRPSAARRRARRASSRTSARRAPRAHARRAPAPRAARPAAPGRGVSLENLFERLQEGQVQDLNLVVKGDVVGSVEAAVSELQKIQHAEVRVNVIHQASAGSPRTTSCSPPRRARWSSASTCARTPRRARSPSARASRSAPYRVIYQLTEDIEQALVGMLPPVEIEETLGEAEVRALFRVSRLGTIAGCMVTRGVVRRGAQVRVVRDGTLIYETTIARSSASRTTRARSARASSAASCSRASTT